MVWASSSDFLGTNSPKREHSKPRKMNEEKVTKELVARATEGTKFMKSY